MRERTRTGDALAPGRYVFVVDSEPEKTRNEGGKVFYKFSFNTVVNGANVIYKERFPVWLLDPLLKALGAKEVAPKEWEWDTQEVIGKQVEADVTYENFDGKTYPRMKNIVEKLPF